MFEENVFALKDDEYKQDIDPIKEYIYQTAYFLHKQLNKSIEECEEIVKKELKSNKQIFNPTVTYLERKDNGDREKLTTSLTDYIYSSIKNRRIIAPTLTTYLNENQKKSFIAKIVKDNIRNRYIVKKEAFIAKADGRAELAIIKDNEQTNFKLINNSFSGAHTTPSTPFYNKTAHSTLTSTTRLTASIANANNEKLLTGNRHYWNKDIVLNNITSIISHTDYNLLIDVMEKYQLHYPTAQEALDCILYSTELYWHSLEANAEIMDYLSKLTPLELAAFVYTNDLYQIRRLNENFMREFITEFSKKCEYNLENRLELVNKIPGAVLNLVHQICNEEVKGLGTKYGVMEEKGILDKLVSIASNVYSTNLKYKDFINIFLVTKNIPASVAYFPNSVRRAVVASDTDSTIFTVQDWVYWYFGKYIVDDASIAVSAVLVFFTSQTIYHILSLISANCNYAKENLHRLSMKNEFRFDVFVPTQVSKHYFAIIGCREGNVYSEYEEEIKGVHLKNSNLPKEVNELGKKLMQEIMIGSVNNKEIHLKDILNKVLDVETKIYESLIKGNPNFYRSFRLKKPDSYKLEAAKSPYIHHMFWKEVFESKYGFLEEPPYTCIKLSTTLHNKSSLLEFIDGIKDKQIKDNFIEYIKKYNKISLKTIMLSKAYVNQNGIPEELLPAINTKKVIMDICNIFYIILETLGYYKKPDVILRDIYNQEI